jgi:hypothetical protein
VIETRTLLWTADHRLKSGIDAVSFQMKVGTYVLTCPGVGIDWELRVMACVYVVRLIEIMCDGTWATGWGNAWLPLYTSEPWNEQPDKTSWRSGFSLVSVITCFVLSRFGSPPEFVLQSVVACICPTPPQKRQHPALVPVCSIDRFAAHRSALHSFVRFSFLRGYRG